MSNIEHAPLHLLQDFYSSYADFLALLDNEKSRGHLENLRASESRADPVFQKVKQISAVFERSLDNIFFENVLLKPLIRKYGVF